MRTKLLSISLTVMIITPGCSNYVPSISASNNCCEIFKENFSWYKSARASEKKWGIPVSLQMAIIFQESSYKHNATPEREYLLGLIPWKRKSSAYGYGQVLKSTWNSYEKSQPKWILSRSRNDFDDVADFIGWYLSRASKRLGIKLTDSYNLYLVYHEGIGGYNRKSYQNNAKLKRVAHKVEKKANLYRRQIKGCRSSLLHQHPFYAIFY